VQHFCGGPRAALRFATPLVESALKIDIRKFMKRKSISDRRSVENNSDKGFQK